ncbi:hypothetical protein [Piscinibacterium candidicorallinum]|jgi:hypothetical protein|uniref:Uncharacterized protein n=1 Tax=Piscinibacterium candidicorallinum TaxID=1793872 RepID=A0ABV7H0S4_9BURK
MQHGPLSRNTAKLQSSLPADERARELARRSLIQARLLDMPESMNCLHEIDRMSAERLSAEAQALRATAWAVNLSYTVGWTQSRSAFSDAVALARECSEQAVVLEVLSWYALYYPLADHRSIAPLDAIVQIIGAVDHADADTLARAGYAAQGLFLTARQMAPALAWAQFATRQARRSGDPELERSVLRYMTLAQADDVRLDWIAGQPNMAALKQAIIGLESGQMFSEALGLKQSSFQAPLVLAGLLTLSGEHARALALFDAHLDEAEYGLGLETSGHFSDRALCLAHLGRMSDARAMQRRAQEAVAQTDDVIDQYLAFIHFNEIQLRALEGVPADDERPRLAAVLQRLRAQEDLIRRAINARAHALAMPPLVSAS